MKKYLFKSTTTMKEYNNKKWWIDGDIIRDFVTDAENITQALKNYCDFAENSGISISKNALKNKNAMYIDTPGDAVQCGYVITGKTDFNDDINYKWVSQFIDIWVKIFIIENPFKMEA